MMENWIRKENVDKAILKREKQKLSDTIHQSEHDFDKRTLYISSGTLGLSLTLLHKSSSPECIWILRTGWILLVLSICIDLFSYLYARKRVWIIRELLSKDIIDLNAINTHNHFTNKIIIAISWIIFTLLISGIALIVTFVCLNN